MSLPSKSVLPGSVLTAIAASPLAYHDRGLTTILHTHGLLPCWSHLRGNLSQETLITVALQDALPLHQLHAQGPPLTTLDNRGFLPHVESAVQAADELMYLLEPYRPY